MTNEKPNAKETYVCPKCSRSITLYVKPSAAPLCSNPDRHTSIHIPMEKRDA